MGIAAGSAVVGCACSPAQRIHVDRSPGRDAGNSSPRDIRALASKTLVDSHDCSSQEALMPPASSIALVVFALAIFILTWWIVAHYLRDGSGRGPQ
jgi:hypothetical protein